MAKLGVQGFELPDWMREEQAEDRGSFGVLAENWDAALAFAACGTQWAHDARGVPTGLRYADVDVVLRRTRVADPDDAFERLRIMEAAAAAEFRRIAARSQ